MSIDAGLRAFMLGVYNKMALGLLVSAGIAYAVATVPAIRDMLFIVSETGAFRGYTLPGMILAFAPLALVLISGFAMRNPSPAGSAALYWVLRYTGGSIASTFLITATAFGALSLVGYTTKKDLTGFGSFLIMGVWGILIASIVNIFLKQPMLYWIINAVGVLIFAGLTAYDTQRLKMTYYAIGGDEAGKAVATNYGALSLYLDFINLFQFLLAFLGGRRE
jgi:FtsH-binding integral membrane protein